MTHNTRTIPTIIAALAAISLSTLWLAQPADAAPPETTNPETCVPEGFPVTDIDTGNTYIYSGEGPLGFDSCGQPIPNICVDWGDHHSMLWTLNDCSPQGDAPAPTVDTGTAPTPAPPMELPATGNEVWLAGFGAAALLAGLTTLRIARR